MKKDITIGGSLAENLYGVYKKVETKTREDVQIVPTMIESVYGDTTLLFDRQKKDFSSSEEAEQWARENGIIIVIRHKAKSFIGDNLKDRLVKRDDSEKMRF